MRIAVCVKQVPSSNEVRMDPVTNTIIRDGKQSVINPYDRFALELALQIKERLGGSVVVVSMGIPATARILKEALSCGADEAVLLSDRAFAGADTLATSYTLHLGIRKIEQRFGKFDLVLCGRMAIDGDTAQIGPELAEQLGIPHITDMEELLEISQEQLICCRLADGERQRVAVQLPVLLTVNKDINQPRLPNIEGVLWAETAPLHLWNAAGVQADLKRCGLTGSPTQVVRTQVPQRDQECKILQGSVSEQLKALQHLLKGED